MPNKPLIGLNGDFRPTRKDAIALSWFNTGYYDSITATRLKTGPRESDCVNPIPLLLPPLANDDELRQILQMLDGLVLAGCVQDLDPVRMGFEKHPHTRPMPPRREDFDRRLCKLAVEMRMPILAIGGGMLMTYFQWLGMRGDSSARRVLDSYFKFLVLVSFVTGAVTVSSST